MDTKKFRILIVEDDDTELFGYQKFFEHLGYTIHTAPSLAQAKEQTSRHHFDSVFLDLQLPDGNSLEWLPDLSQNAPDTVIFIITGVGDIPRAVSAMKHGAEHFFAKPVDLKKLENQLSKILEAASRKKRTRSGEHIFEQDNPCFGSSVQMKSLLEYASVGAASDSIILLQGETGTGKGVLANWIHRHSQRKNEIFVQLNCSMLKGDLLRSELFGHVKGAFTSAIKDKIGLVETADTGTLFLDEIGDLDLEVQAQMLTAIEERMFRRVGDNKSRRSNFRLICASNKDLLKAAQSGEFRSDLYYRICVFPLAIPPLRERTEDIPILCDYFLDRFGFKHHPLSTPVYDLLASYSWPGNVRELRNMIERAVLLAQDGPITPDHFPGLDILIVSEENSQPSISNLKDLEKDHVLRVVEQHNGDKKKAAKALGISLSSLYRKLV